MVTQMPTFESTGLQSLFDFFNKQDDAIPVSMCQAWPQDLSEAVINMGC